VGETAFFLRKRRHVSLVTAEPHTEIIEYYLRDVFLPLRTSSGLTENCL
jgi:hypothetical protein